MSTIACLYKISKKSKSIAATDPSLKYYYRCNETDISGTTTKYLLNIATQTSDLTLAGANPTIDTTTGKSAFKITDLTPTNIAYLTTGAGTGFYSSKQSWALKFYMINSNNVQYMNILTGYPNSAKSGYLFTFQGIFNGTINSSSVTLRFYFPNASFPISGAELVLTNAAALNTWYSMVITQDGLAFSIYLNGSFVYTKTSTTAGSLSTTASNVFQFGQETGGNSAQKMNGYIDEFRIYNKVLSSTEVSNLHNYDDLTPTPAPTDPIIHFKGDVNDITSSSTDVTNYGSISGTGSFSTVATLSSVTNKTISINTTSYKVGNGCLDLSLGSYIKMPNIILSSTSNGFSFCCWVKTTALVTDYNRIFDLSNSSGDARILLMCPNATDFQFGTKIPGGSLNLSSIFTGLSTTNWTHITWTLTASGVSAFYVNGNVKGGFSNALFKNNITYDWSLIGASKGFGNAFLGAYLDDIKFFDRVLSPGEIMSNYLLL